MKLSNSAALALGALISVSVACGDSTGPSQPSGATQPVIGSPVSTPAFPAPSKRGDIYNESTAIYAFSYPYHGGSLVSRYVLYEDGTFALQFVSAAYGFFEYLGTYRRDDTLITFAWNGWSSTGAWTSTATQIGDSMSVKYNLDMVLSDFADGQYVKAAATSP
jgi:hypothetical protein